MKKNNAFVGFICFVIAVLFSCCKEEITNNGSNQVGEFIMDFDPSWSPTGGFIVYAGGYNNPKPGLYKIDTSGNDKELISSDYVKDPQVSSNGKWTLFERNGNIFKLSINGDSLIQLTFDGGNFYPAWSKDNQFIAFDNNHDSPNGMYFVWKMRSDGTDKKRIIYAPSVGEVRRPSWFPDGIKIGVIRWFPDHQSPDIGIIDTNGNSILTLTNDNFYDRDIKVSNDGSMITYTRDTNLGQVCLIKTDGSNFRIILNKNSRFPNWSPDDKQIIYTNTTDQDGRLWVINLLTLVRKPISN